MALMLSTGLRNQLLGNKSLADILSGGIIKIFSGVPPTSPDAAETGSLLVTITNNGSTTLQAKQVTLTFLPSDSVEYSVTLEGITFKYTSGTGATANEIATNLKTEIEKVTLGEIYVPSLTNRVTLSLNADDTLSIVGTQSNDDWTISVSDRITLKVDQPALYGLHFEDYSNITDGILVKRDDEIWQGKCVESGTASYYRFVLLDDDGSESQTFPRLQGTVGTVNADMIVSTTALVKDAIQTISMASYIIPIS